MTYRCHLWIVLLLAAYRLVPWMLSWAFSKVRFLVSRSNANIFLYKKWTPKKKEKKERTKKDPLHINATLSMERPTNNPRTLLQERSKHNELILYLNQKQFYLSRLQRSLQRCTEKCIIGLWDTILCLFSYYKLCQ